MSCNVLVSCCLVCKTFNFINFELHCYCLCQGTESDVISHQNNNHWDHIQLLASRLHQLPMDTIDYSTTAAATSSHVEVYELLAAGS